MKLLSEVFHKMLSKAISVKVIPPDGVHLSDELNLFFRELCHAVFFANARAALRGHVSHILKLRSQEEVVRVHACRIVCVMSNELRTH